MKKLLTSDLCDWPGSQVKILQDVSNPSDLARELVELTRGVQDVLLLYYAGHGMRMPNGQLALALRGTSSDPTLREFTVMTYKGIAEILRRCPAATKLVILDCCHAELGNRANDQFQSVDIDSEPVAGLYCIWASREWEKARAPMSGGLTYFTETFVKVVRDGIPGKPSNLTIEQIFTELRSRLLHASLPEPAQSGVRDAGHWIFARNAAPPETHRDPGQAMGLRAGPLGGGVSRRRRMTRILAAAIGAAAVIAAAFVAVPLANSGASNAVAPGDILTADGVVITANRPSPAGDAHKYQLYYPEHSGPLFAPVTGYHAPNSAADVAQAEHSALSRGDSVQLTISAKIQRVLSSLDWQGGGGVVALNPHSGAILAMAMSAKSTLPPDSTFNIVTSSAWYAQDAARTPRTVVASPSSLRLPDGGTLSNDNGRCGHGSGHTSVLKAFARSCDTSFAQMGLHLGGAPIKSAATSFGLNHGLGIPGMTVAASTFSAEASKSLTAYDAIGQHDTTVTPLQEALFAAAVANDGVLMKPYLIGQVTASDASVVAQTEPQELSQPMSATVAGYEKQMMIAAMQQQPAATRDSPGLTGVAIAGVTGTTPKGSTSPDTVFTAFAPANDPQIAVGVIFKGNESAATVEGIAIDVIQLYLEPSG
jgi:hypothetical protein